MGYAARRAALIGTAPYSAGNAERGNKGRDARVAASKATVTLMGGGPSGDGLNCAQSAFGTARRYRWTIAAAAVARQA